MNKPKAEGTIKLKKGETLECTRCGTWVLGPAVAYLVATHLRGDAEIEEVLCQKCSGKRGE